MPMPLDLMKSLRNLSRAKSLQAVCDSSLDYFDTRQKISYNVTASAYENQIFFPGGI